MLKIFEVFADVSNTTLHLGPEKVCLNIGLLEFHMCQICFWSLYTIYIVHNNYIIPSIKWMKRCLENRKIKYFVIATASLATCTLVLFLSLDSSDKSLVVRTNVISVIPENFSNDGSRIYNDFNKEIIKQTLLIKQMQQEIKRMKEKLSCLEQMNKVNLKRMIFLHLSKMLNPRINRIVSDLLNNPEFLSVQEGFSNWLHITQQSSLLKNLHQENHFIENIVKKVTEKVVTLMSNDRLDAIAEEQIRKIVKITLMIYGGDKRELFDYALNKNGAKIVSVTAKVANHPRWTVTVPILNLQISRYLSPNIIITDNKIRLGECWAFQDFPSIIVIKLANKIRIDAFSLEHIDAFSASPEEAGAAPKEFEIFGLQSKNENRVKIGKYIYKEDGDAIQYFTSQQRGMAFLLVELRINSNHGNPNFTCLYRFRVYGIPIRKTKNNV